jgi:hypothetical protein
VGIEADGVRELEKLRHRDFAITALYPGDQALLPSQALGDVALQDVPPFTLVPNELRQVNVKHLGISGRAVCRRTYVTHVASTEYLILATFAGGICHRDPE